MLLVAVLAMLVGGAASADAALGVKAMWGKDGGLGGLGLADGELITPSAIAEGPDTFLYVTEQADCSVRVFDQSGWPVRRWGGVCDSFSPSQTGLRIPYGIAVDMNGDVYVADALQNRIQVYDSYGVWQRTIGGYGTTGGGLSSPHGVAVTPFSLTPSVYVADTANYRVQKFDADGTWRWAAGENVDSVAPGTGFEVCTNAGNCTAGAQSSNPGSFRYPTDLTLASGSKLLVADLLNDRVAALDDATGATTTGGFASTAPWGITASGGGDIWVVRASYGGPYVDHYDGGGNLQQTLANGVESSADGGMSAPGKPGAAGGGGVWIPDANMHRVQQFDSSGAFGSKFGKNGGPGWQRGSGDGEFAYPRGVFASASNVWVADMANNRIQKFGLTGSFVNKFGAAGMLGGQLNQPSDVAVDGSGDVWVVDTYNQRVQEFDSSGGFLKAFGKNVDTAAGTGFEICTVAVNCQMGSTGSGTGEFNYPVGIAISPTNGNVYVVDQNNQRIQIFNPTSLAYVGSVGSAGSGDGQFQSPQDLAFEPGGAFWVADFSNLRLQRFDGAGTFSKKFNLGVVNGTGVAPQGVAYSGGDVYASEWGVDRVAAFDASAASAAPTAQPALFTFGATGSNTGDVYSPEKIAAGPTTGDIYLVDAGNNRIQLFGDTTVVAPSLTIDNPPPPPAPDMVVDSPTVGLAYTATNSGGEPLHCTPGVGEVPLQLTSNAPTLNTITVTCVNPLGSPLSQSVSVTRIPPDTTAPVVDITSPLDHAVVTDSHVTLAFDASDEDGYPVTCDMTTGDTILLDMGDNVISVTCYDVIGNAGNDFVTVTYQPPAPPAASPKTPVAAPALKLALAKATKFKRTIAATASCDGKCDLTLKATLKLDGKTLAASARGSLAGAGSLVLSARFSKRNAAAIKQAIAAGAKPKVTLTLTGAGPGGTAAPVTLKTKLKK